MCSRVKLDGCAVSTAKSLDEIKENIKNNIGFSLLEINSRPFWRENQPIAIVGGGPSLNNYVYELQNIYYNGNRRYIIACGSVHDYLIRNEIYPDYTVICDPDEVMLEYLQLKNIDGKYLVASQCHPKVFE